jgi:hypothetical protein
MPIRGMNGSLTLRHNYAIKIERYKRLKTFIIKWINKIP